MQLEIIDRDPRGVDVVSLESALLSCFGTTDPTYTVQSVDTVLDWCQKHNAHWYGRLREDFDREEAIRQCLAEGKTVLVMEDLS